MVETTETASIERQEEAFESPSEFVTYWRKQLEAADKMEKPWRERGDAAVKKYRGEDGYDGDSFNILHSNVATIVPAVYNSSPVPDIRPRYEPPAPMANPQDPQAGQQQMAAHMLSETARKAAQVIERAIVYQIDGYDFDSIIKTAVKDQEVPGRGQVRVRYETFTRQDTETGEELIWEEVPTEHVPWRHFRRGPGTTWQQVPWVAYRKSWTADELDKLTGSREKSAQVPLDASDEGFEDGEKEISAFKKANGWEIWDKKSRTVIFIADGYHDEPLAQVPDPFGLLDFFPSPAPLVPIADPDNMVPIVPYDIYRSQAEELSVVSKRILKLTEIMKFRGIHASELAELAELDALEDGQFAPSEQAMTLLTGGQANSLDAAIWVVPLDRLIVVLKELVAQREAIKQSIYEITGIADIMRGVTAASETLGAQQIKATWGSLRVQDRQAMVQRFCRDIFRIKAEIIGNKFSEETLSIMAGEPLQPDVIAALRNDLRRAYLIDVETDSTIRADLTRSQQNMTTFLQGSAQFFQSFVPLLQSQALPPQVAQVAIAAYSSFARQYRLGKQVEDALAQLAIAAEQMGMGQPSPEEQRQQQIQEDSIEAKTQRDRSAATKDDAIALKTAIEAGRQPERQNGARPQ